MRGAELLVTGAGGQVARALLAAAARRGLTTAALRHEDLAVEDRSAVQSLLGHLRPGAVVHCAAWTDVDGCEADPDRAARINGEAPGHVADACAVLDARLVHLSTDFVFSGRGRTTPYREQDPTEPLSVYGRSKAQGEQAVLARGGAGLHVVRTSWVFGPGGKHFPRAIMARARRGEPLRVVTDQRGAPTLTVDLAEAILDLLTADPPGGIWHCTNAGDCTWHEFARAVLRSCGLGDRDVTAITAAELGRPAARPAYSVLDCSKLAALRGQAMPGWQDALARYLSLEPL